MRDEDTLTTYTSSFVDELAKQELKHVVISPGSRSTPLALLFADHPNIHIHINIDERSAAFFALGLAKATNEPVALVCSSGTAAANYYPGIIEAYYARVPLVVLTADRPHELRDVGAPQTIDQIHLYGKHVKWFMDMALPESDEKMARYVRAAGARALATARKEPAGPVHVNFPFREPLVPDLTKKRKDIDSSPSISQNVIESGSLTLSSEQIDDLVNLFKRAKQGIIVCGELGNEDAKKSIIRLSETLAFPILADPLSQLRSGKQKKENIIDTYDTFLRDEDAQSTFAPDVVLRFGAMPVSKALLLFLKKQQQATHLVVDGGGGWREPAGLAANMIYCSELHFCEELLTKLPLCEETRWLSLWKKVNEITKEALESARDESELTEARVFSLLEESLPSHATLFVGNSMPIRDVDTFFHTNDKDIRIFGNRGANGIDGIVSTALGVSTVSDHTALVIGDVSFFHDMNGLLAAKLQKQKLTILLINNDGGGIFSFLPQSKEKEHFEELFGTPHALDFSHTANLYEADYCKVETADAFKKAFKESFEKPGLKIIEVPSERGSNVLEHRQLWDKVSRALLSIWGEEA